MNVSASSRRAQLLTPYAPEHERSLNRRMESGVMPKDLGSLLRWYEDQWSLETPDRLHVQAVWKDKVTLAEAEQGIQPVGGSDTGAPAYSETFRQRIENSPSQLDEDGYYIRPLASALSRIGRGTQSHRAAPIMARVLMSVVNAGFDWCSVADRSGWHHEMFEVYLREALIRLWKEHREQKVIAA